jgi:hypothetical protein
MEHPTKGFLGRPYSFRPSKPLRKVFLFSWLIALLGVIGYVLWHEDWKYTLPTPVPNGYDASRPVNGEYIASQVMPASSLPLFIHFFNPKCPCSRFNIPHFRALVSKYEDRLKFIVVAMTSEDEYSKEDIRKRLDLDLPVFFERAIADSCGVYSTPQAVILDSDKKLYYRGNYNRSRFCTDKNTNFAQMAVDSLLSDRDTLITEIAATKSYGCCLPNCVKPAEDEE